MPSFENHPSSKRTKLLLVGDSGTGKTASLASLANAGYKVRILDFDAGLDILKNYLTPEGVKNVTYITLKDDLAKATAWQTGRDIVFKGWKTPTEDLGKVQDWGPDVVLVADSLTFMGDAAKHAAAALNGKQINGQLTQQEWGEAVRVIENFLDYITSDYIKCNVVMTALPVPLEDDSGVSRLYPFVVTKAFSSTKVAKYFNNLFRVANRRDGTPYFRTAGDARMACKSSAPGVVKPEEDADLASIFKKLQGTK